MSDNGFVLARGVFFAKVDRMVGEALMAHSRDGTPPAVDSEECGSSPSIELGGDWSWRPENQVKDPGYEFTAKEVAAVNEMWMGFGAFCDQAKAFQRQLMLSAVPPRPWLVPAHTGAPARPARIACIR